MGMAGYLNVTSVVMVYRESGYSKGEKQQR